MSNEVQSTQGTQEPGGHESYHFAESRKVYDPVHGFIRFDKNIWKVIDTPEFQRLREIKQLGALYFVFPSAVHTRFEHCIGTAYLCQKYMDKLIQHHPDEYPERKRAESRLMVTLAGLLHDIGHGPFSHMFDNEFMGNKKQSEEGPETNSPEKPKPEKKEKWSHETAGLCIIEHMFRRPELKDVLNSDQVARVCRLIMGQPKEDDENIWEFEIVSNKISGIDVDRFDYFRRDSFYLGIHNVYVDFDLLMDQTLIIDSPQDNKKRLCYPVKYADKVLDIFHSRYKLFKGYYQNKIVKGIQIMLCEVFDKIDKSYGIKEACQSINTNPQLYCNLTDNIIYEVLRMRDNELPQDSEKQTQLREAKDIMRKIQSRKLYKFVADADDLDTKKDEKSKFIKQSAHEILDEILACSKEQNGNHTQGLSKDDIAICVGYLDYGSKDKHPIDQVRFYRKNIKPYSICEVNTNTLSILKTEQAKAQERFVRLYVKDETKFEQAKHAFQKACQVLGVRVGAQRGTPSQQQLEKSSHQPKKNPMGIPKPTVK